MQKNYLDLVYIHKILLLAQMFSYQMFSHESILKVINCFWQVSSISHLNILLQMSNNHTVVMPHPELFLSIKKNKLF